MEGNHLWRGALIHWLLENGPVMSFRMSDPKAIRGAAMPSRLIAIAVVLSVIWADPQSALRGFVLLALGIPVYYWYATRERASTDDSRLTTD